MMTTNIDCSSKWCPHWHEGVHEGMNTSAEDKGGCNDRDNLWVQIGVIFQSAKIS